MKRPAVAAAVAFAAAAVAICLFQLAAPTFASANSDPVGKVCPGRLTMSLAGQMRVLPYCTSQPLDAPDPGIGLLIVVIHGSSRDAEGALGAIAKSVAVAGARGTGTLIVAPQFLMDVDAKAHKLANDVLRWRRLAGGADWEEGWDQGNDSDSVTGAVSSFAVLDGALEALTDVARFPNLKRIVLTGLSLGAQFVNRYAAGTLIEQKLLEERGLRMRYVIAAPSSYLYFDEQRPTSGAAAGFAPPSTAERSRCPGWNTYRYGLETLNPYMLAVGKETMRSQYPTREVVYLVGQEDNEGEMSCPARLQGSNRLERARSYWSYLQRLFGGAIEGQQALFVVPGIAHSWSLFTSRCGLDSLFSADLPTECAS